MIRPSGAPIRKSLFSVETFLDPWKQSLLKGANGNNRPSGALLNGANGYNRPSGAPIRKSKGGAGAVSWIPGASE